MYRRTEVQHQAVEKKSSPAEEGSAEQQQDTTLDSGNAKESSRERLYQQLGMSEQTGERENASSSASSAQAASTNQSGTGAVNSQLSGQFQRLGSEGARSLDSTTDDIMQPRIISEIKSQIIEVPIIEETIKHVRKIEVVEVEKKVPKYEIEYIERIVEVPRVKIVEKYEEYEVIQEVTKYVPKKEFVNVPREVVRYTPKIETTYIEKVVEVLSRDQIIEIRKPYTVDQHVPYPVYKDKEVGCVVAQKMMPVVRESKVELLDVEVCKFVPQVIPVDVYIPRPVQVPLIPVKKSDDVQSRVEVPAPQFNTLLVNLNSHLSGEEKLIIDLPFRKGGDGNVPMLMSDQYNSTVTIACDQSAFQQRVAYGDLQASFQQRVAYGDLHGSCQQQQQQQKAVPGDLQAGSFQQQQKSVYGDLQASYQQQQKAAVYGDYLQGSFQQRGAIHGDFQPLIAAERLPSCSWHPKCFRQPACSGRGGCVVGEPCCAVQQQQQQRAFTSGLHY